MKRNRIPFYTLISLLIIIVSGCNLSSSEPIPKAVPNIDIDRALVVDTYRDTFDGDCVVGDCSLRDAVFIANTTPKNTIYLPSGLYKLNEQTLINDDTGRYGDLDISSFVTIQGDGVDLTTIDGVNNDRIFQILANGGNLTLYDMALMGGSGDHPSGLSGDMPSGGLISDGIEAIGCAISSLWGGCDNAGTITNTVPDDYQQIKWEKGGGAIANAGILTLQNVNVVYNVAQFGGAIFNTGSATITGGELCNNKGRYGGGIYNVGNIEIAGTNICNNNSNSLIPDSWGPSEIWLTTRFDLFDWNTWAPEFESNLLILGGGGGIYNTPSGSINLINSVISENKTHYKIGTGIINKGFISLFDSQVIDNFGDAILNFGRVDIVGSEIGLSVIAGNGGSALQNIGDANIIRTLIHDNSPYGSGSIVGWTDSVTNIDQSAIFENQTDLGAGAIAILGGEFTLTNVSIGKNLSNPGKGTLFIESGNALLSHVTIFNNLGTGISNLGGNVQLLNTIISSNSENCSGAISSQGHNLDSGTTCNLTRDGDISSTIPNIIDLLDASTRFTFKIPANSTAHDAGDLENCAAIDQQGEQRPMGLGCDIGADEVREIVGIPITIPGNIEPSVEQPDSVAPVNDSPPPVIAEEDANCRSGPGIIYTSLAFFFKGDSAEILGQNIANDWVFVKLISDQNCWVWEGTLTEDSVFENVEVLPDPPTPTFTPSPTLTLTPTPTLTPIPSDPGNASISGFSWNDNNGNGSKNSGEGFLAQTSVKLGSGACNSIGLQSVATNFVGSYAFTGLSAGTYCVSASRTGDISAPSTSTNVTIVLSASQSVSVNFGFQEMID